MPTTTSQQPDVFMSVKQVAEYLHLNEKKIYSLVSDGKIPATKITGKWMFPRELVDHWMLDSAHGGLLTDRLIIAGSDDPLIYRLVLNFAHETGSHALISYTPTGTRLGLELLQANRVDACGIHWGPNSESHTRHPALLRQHHEHHKWVLIRAFRREQGLVVRSDLTCYRNDISQLFDSRFRWSLRQSGAGSQRFLLEMLSRYNMNSDQLNASVTSLSEREAASSIAMGLADVAPGTRATAEEYGACFIPVGWEAFDLALPRGIWFRRLFQNLVGCLQSQHCRTIADSLTGYDLSEAGKLVWGDE
ncbi:MAG: helix-turn-helix transcriptional regulator [Gammaproteobacteria bacterium]|nr:helix-turn-helix transcriptional regulator [Gammaproteobacteria bacterium]